jgi:hypothetical protein
MAAPSRFHAPATLWTVDFVDGTLDAADIGIGYFCRAVRGGL